MKENIRDDVAFWITTWNGWEEGENNLNLFLAFGFWFPFV